MSDNLKYIDELANDNLKDFAVQSDYDDWKIMQSKIRSSGRWSSRIVAIITSLVIISSAAVLYWTNSETGIIQNKQTVNNENVVTEVKENEMEVLAVEKNINSEKAIVDQTTVVKIVKTTETSEEKIITANTINNDSVSQFRYEEVVKASDSKKRNETENDTGKNNDNNHEQQSENCESVKYIGCAPFTVKFHSQKLNAKMYNWEFGNGFASVEKEPTFTYLSAGVYVVNLKINDTEEVVKTDTVVVIDSPKASIVIPEDTVQVPGSPFIAIANVEKTTNCYWYLGDGKIMNGEKVIHYYEETGKYNLSLIATNNYGCSDSVTIFNAVTVIGAGKLIFPNAFEPNSDGPNGGYYTLGEQDRTIFHPMVAEGIKTYHLMIYDRGGRLVFETKDIRQGWDGYNNYNLCRLGTYLYIVKGTYQNGKVFAKTGDVLLYR